jgi:hypothetical protein
VTGYTSRLVDEKLDFKSFVLMCAGSFGPWYQNDQLPETLIPDDHHLKEATKEEERLTLLQSFKITLEKKQWAIQQLQEKIDFIEKHCIEKNDTRKIMCDMLEQVRRWTPPSESHLNLKKFMENQLTSSIDFTCDDHWKEEIFKFKTLLKDPIQYYEGEVKKTKERIEYHREQWKKEVEITKNLNLWLRQLRDSLGVSV